MTVSGTPGTGAVTLGSAQSGFQSVAAAGGANGDTIPYLLEDGSNWEFGVGTYTSSGTSFARTSVTQSSAGGTTKISASSSTLFSATVRAEDLSNYFIGGTPPSIVQTQAVQGSGIISVTFGAAPTNGNLLVAFFFDTGGNPTAGSGWTALDLATSAALDASIFTKVAGASESTTQTPSSSTGGQTSLIVWEISGAVTGVVDFQAVGSNGSSVPTGRIPAIPTLPSSLFLAAIASTIPATGISSVYGLATSAILSSAGVQTGYGHSDSSNAQSFSESAIFAAATAFGYTSVVIM